MMKTIPEIKESILSAIEKIPDQLQTDFGSHRTFADQIEYAVRQLLIKTDNNYRHPTSVRTAADVYYDDGNVSHINIKSMDVSKQFHMPNLIAANSLKKILDNGHNFILVRITHDAGKILAKECWEIREISWDSLQIGALGAGQIQISNATLPIQMHTGGNDLWWTIWRNTMIDYYYYEIKKAEKRLRKWES